MHSELYISKARRDARAKYLTNQGVAIKRRSHRGQQLHPMYVEDYTAETGIVLTEADKGFGNTIYRTYFKVLYAIEWEVR